MGASSSVDEAQFNALKNTVNSQASKINALDALKSKVDNLSTAAASGIEYTKLAEAINKEANYRENLAVAIAKNPNDLGANLAAEIGKNNSILENLNSKLAASTTLQDKVADTLSSNDKYKERIRGSKGVDGSIGDQAALKSNLFDKGNTMWCADGEFCEIPTNKKGINLSGGTDQRGFNQGIIGFKKWSDKVDLVGAGNGMNRWVKVWDNIETGSVQANGDIKSGGDNFRVGMFPGWDGGSIRSKGTMGIVNGDNNDWKAVIDGGDGGRVYAKNRVQIGDFIFYTDGDRLYLWHPKNPGKFIARFSATDPDRVRFFADGDGNKGKYFYVSADKKSGIADIGERVGNPNG